MPACYVTSTDCTVGTVEALWSLPKF
uniref:Uncharacterized protein n=1 Tax=Anguilla anguilla TaxID=7936 RepID=A0A0E9UJ17_ANGAN